MFNSKIKNHLDLNTKEIAITNPLNVNNCLFTTELLIILLISYKNEYNYFEHHNRSFRKLIKNKKGVYLIVFRIINKKKKIFGL